MRSTAASRTMRAQLGIPVNAVDSPELCDFFTPAIVNRAPVCVAIGTEGAAPVLAQSIRTKIDQLLSPSLGALAALAASLRDIAERLLPKGRMRRQFWNDFFGGAPARAMEVGHADEALQAASELLQPAARPRRPCRAGRRRPGRGRPADACARNGI